MTSPLTVLKSVPLKGHLSAPGDKSISHRALILGALAIGQTKITGLLEGEDVLATADALRAMGVPIEKEGDIWRVTGRGVGGLAAPSGDLDFGNSGTGTRLMMGVIAGHDMTVRMIGDASLSTRPMGRVLHPLCDMGLNIKGADGIDAQAQKLQLPLTLVGTNQLMPMTYHSPVASAQVKTAILLAGLHASGKTTVIEKHLTRDHTEHMLRFFGADIKTARLDEGYSASVIGQPTLQGGTIKVPGDPSSAAFFIAAALIVPESQITIENVLINPTRTGFFETLKEMGAALSFRNERTEAGEQVADISVKYGPLNGITVPAARVPSMIDEYPVLAAVAAYANGTTRMEGLGELRVKECDRLQVTTDGLVANGIDAKIQGDDLIVTGSANFKGGGTVKTHMDHRIAMAFLTLGLNGDQPVSVDDTSMIMTSFPDFQAQMVKLGAQYE